MTSLSYPLLEEASWEAWALKPDFYDLARALNPIVILLCPLPKSSIGDAWALEPGFTELARAPNPSLSYYIPY